MDISTIKAKMRNVAILMDELGGLFERLEQELLIRDKEKEALKNEIVNLQDRVDTLTKRLKK